MEKEILDIIIRLCYRDRLKELYEKRENNIEFPIKLSLPANFKVVSDFCDDYFFKYEKILLENALIYALYIKEKNYLTFIKEHIFELRKTIDNDLPFRLKTADLGIKNITNKNIANINIDEKIKRENSELFNIIEKTYTDIKCVTLLYRNIIMNFLDTTYNEDREILLDTFLLTDEVNKYFIELNQDVNEKDLKYLKQTLVRLILFDNYLHIEKTLEDINNYNESYDNDYLKNILNIEKDDHSEDIDYEIDDENEDEMDIETDYENSCKEILNHINLCIKRNKFNLPTNTDLRFNMYSKFLSYNLYLDDRKYDYNKIESDKVKALKLSKINPLYKLELLNFNK